MNIYLVSQDENNDYDTYDSFVCIAKNEYEAKNLKSLSKDKYGSWAWSIDRVKVVQIGVALEGAKTEVVIESFNAG